MSDDARKAMDLAERIKPLLAGHGPQVQSAALIDLVSLWLAGHPKAMHGELLVTFMATVREMTPVNVAKLFGEAGHPADRH